MAARVLGTELGALRLVVREEALLDEVRDLALDAALEPGAIGRLVEVGGVRAYLKAGPLRGKARVRHALRTALLRRLLPRENEYANLEWLRAHGFGAPRPLAAGGLHRAGLPVFQLLLTEEVQDAETLRELLARRAPERASVLAELAREVGRLHALGFVHRDLFPRNVLVRHGGEQGRLVLLDAWRGGPRRQLRGPAYDLACLLLFSPELLGREEGETLLECYAAARRGLGRPVAEAAFRRAVLRERRGLARRARRDTERLRGGPAPELDWD